ncbi:MAG: ABC transporter substrate-binding protein [Bacteroidales bacterium]|nr:ABC transporter substrate-binding protein [Bacteroidales bacterium]
MSRFRIGMRELLSLSLSLSLSISLLSGCSGKQNQADDNAGIDLAPEARCLYLADGDGYRIARMYAPDDTVHPVATYLLVPRDKPLPDDLPKGTVVRVPLASTLVYSTVTAEAMKELGSISSVRGVVDKQYFTQPEIQEGLKNGKVTDAGAASSPSAEKIIAMKPDAIILNLYEGMDVAGVDALGVPLIKLMDNHELSPLGRAEWIKLIGSLTGKESIADSIYNSVAANYKRLSEQTSRLGRRPKVLTENMYQGVWYVPGGRSFQSRLIQDAGGDYFRKDDKSAGTLALSFEEVFSKGRDADIWLLKVYDKELTHATLLKEDARYAGFKAAGNGGVYYANTADAAIFNDMVYHPDRLLEDYAEIFSSFSSGKAPNHLRYFRKMPN